MFNTFKKLFGKRVEAGTNPPREFRRATLPAGPSSASQYANPSATLATNGAHGETPAHPNVQTAAGSTLALPLKSVIARLPAELTGRVRQTDVGEAEVFIPMQKVLAQLAHGAVRISFGELRQASPPGTFSAENDRDRVLVELPLHEILSRVKPGLLARRPAQKQVQVPQEVVGPFGGQTRVVISDSPPLKPVAPAAPVAQPSHPAPAPIAPAPAPVKFQPAPQKETAPEEPVFKRFNTPAGQPGLVTNASMAAAPAARPQPAPQKEMAPEAPIFKRFNAPAAQPGSGAPAPAVAQAVPQSASPPPAIQMSPALRQMAAPVPTAGRSFVPAAHAPAPVAAPARVEIPISVPAPAPAPAPAAVQAPESALGAAEPIRFNPTPKPAPTQSMASGETRFLTASLSDLSVSWPDPVRQEIESLNASTSQVALPMRMMEAALKGGKVAFSWKLIRAWIKPPLQIQSNSPHDAVLLDLPLKVLTPLFMAELRTLMPQKKVVIDEEIPDLFSGTPPPEAATPAPAPIAVAAVVPPGTDATDTNYYVAKNGASTQEEAPIILKKGATPGTNFLQRYATPNEIVGKAAALSGVGGALVALPDGLLVASKVPPDMNADTLAAFLPAIFGRVSTSTKELRMGELNNLNFTVGSIPWKIFRVGAIYFAAFGIAGKPLPTAHLAALAAELDRKPKQ